MGGGGMGGGQRMHFEFQGGGGAGGFGGGFPGGGFPGGGFPGGFQADEEGALFEDDANVVQLQPDTFPSRKERQTWMITFYTQGYVQGWVGCVRAQRAVGWVPAF